MFRDRKRTNSSVTTGFQQDFTICSEKCLKGSRLTIENVLYVVFSGPGVLSFWIPFLFLSRTRKQCCFVLSSRTFNQRYRCIDIIIQRSKCTFPVLTYYPVSSDVFGSDDQRSKQSLPIPSEIWRRVFGFHHNISCAGCFLRRADGRGLHYRWAM